MSSENENNGPSMMGPYGPYKVKNVALGVGAVVGGATVGVLAAPAVVSAVGFGTAGVTAGSTAAAWMSSAGPIAAGSLYASLQSAGAAGLGAAGLGAAAATGGVVGGAAIGGVAAVAGQGRSNGTENEEHQSNEEYVGRIASVINASSSAANSILAGSLHYGLGLTKATAGYIGNYYGGEATKESSSVSNSTISAESFEPFNENQSDRFAFVKDSASSAASSLIGTLQYGVGLTKSTVGYIGNYYGGEATQESSNFQNSSISSERFEPESISNGQATVNENQMDRFAFVKDSASSAASSLYGSLQYGLDSTKATIGSAIGSYYGEEKTPESSKSQNK